MTTATLPNTNPQALPEGSYYPDNGCNLAPACLSCPLPLCKYDDRAVRDRQIVRLRESGWTFARVAAKFGVSERTVNRVLYEHRKRNKRPELEPSLMADSNSGLPPATRAT